MSESPSDPSGSSPNLPPKPPKRRARGLPGVLQSLQNALGPLLQSLPQRLRGLSERLRPLQAKLQQLWAKVLPQVRSRLPGSLNQKLSDRAITAIALSLAFLLLWLTIGLFSGAPTQAKVPKRVVAKQVPAQAIAPSPSPALEPDPNRIVAIQEQVASITDQYSSGLIQSVQANFRSGSLTVKLGDGWYSLSPARQDSLATELLKRSQTLGFSKLEMTDTEGDRVARSPVVGDVMVILQRTVEQEG